MDIYELGEAEFYDYYSLGLNNDVRFYVEEATKVEGPVMELACGTGRILIPVAQSGVDIVGVDRSEHMLNVAREKIATLGKDTRKHIELVEGDMRAFYLDKQFDLIMIPYRSFCHMMNPQDQRAALERVRQHLADDGRLIFNIFDPSLEFLTVDGSFPETALRKHHEFIHPTTGNRVVIWVTRRHDMVNQLIDEDRVFEEVDGSGNVVSKSYSKLNLRWTYRYEMQHLLELSGFKVESLYGDFNRGPFRYGGEQIWTVSKA